MTIKNRSAKRFFYKTITRKVNNEHIIAKKDITLATCEKQLPRHCDVSKKHKQTFLLQYLRMFLCFFLTKYMYALITLRIASDCQTGSVEMGFIACLIIGETIGLIWTVLF